MSDYTPSTRDAFACGMLVLGALAIAFVVGVLLAVGVATGIVRW